MNLNTTKEKEELVKRLNELTFEFEKAGHYLISNIMPKEGSTDITFITDKTIPIDYLLFASFHLLAVVKLSVGNQLTFNTNFFKDLKKTVAVIVNDLETFNKTVN